MFVFVRDRHKQRQPVSGVAEMLIGLEHINDVRPIREKPRNFTIDDLIAKLDFVDG